MEKSNIPKNGKDYLEQLTWLRGLAAFFVIVSHTIRATEVQYSAKDQASDFFIFTSLYLSCLVCLAL